MKIRDVLGVRIFVETGTFQGDTAAWASEHFEQVFTIENEKTLYENARRRILASCSNVTCLLGNSRDRLQEIAAQLQGEPTLFWLDAHWSNIGTYGEDDECPLLDEIRAINQANVEDCAIIIDDARLFMAPPPAPHDPDQWPSLENVFAELMDSEGSHTLSIQRDCILRLRKRDKKALMPTLSAFATEDFNQWVKRDAFHSYSIWKKIMYIVKNLRIGAGQFPDDFYDKRRSR